MLHLVCFHLFNDFSGSPKVLKTVLENIAPEVDSVDIVTSSGEGTLSGLSSAGNVRIHHYPYHFSENPLLTMAMYALVQIYTFFFSLRYIFDRNAVFYINTILPVGPALAARLMGKPVIYHYHENAFVKGLFYRLLAGAMQHLATEIICVSEYQRLFLNRTDNVHVIPNAVPAAFVARLEPDPERAFDRKRVLMLGSLKRYKGTLEFVGLARRLDKFQFELVLNETPENIAAFWKENHVIQPENLAVHPRQNDVAPFYNRASLVLNLSNKELFIETFGLTALEAMSAGLPVIVPTVGGIAEMVEDGVNGYRIDVSETDKLVSAIYAILADRELYRRLASNALACASGFDESCMAGRILGLVRKQS